MAKPGRLLFLLLTITAASARADDTAEARRLFASATKHFDLAEYEAALSDFKEGYRHKDDPVFLYNIGQCYRFMKGHEDDAIKFYKSYLRRLPEASNRASVEHRIEELQAAIAMQEKARTTPPTSTLKPGEVPEEAKSDQRSTSQPSTPGIVVEHRTGPAQEKPIYKRWWLWTAVGAVAVVGVGVGLGVGLSRSGPNNFPTVAF